MAQYKLNRINFCRPGISVVFLLISQVCLSQTLLSGKVIDKATAAPVSFASIEVMKNKGITVCDKYGNFSIVLKNIKKGDTVMISSIGYKTVKLPVFKAANIAIFELMADSIILEPVVFKSFSRRSVHGSVSSVSTGYNRSWNIFGNNSELGRFFKLPYEEYRLDKLEFKVANFCDTCVIRLHIRSVENDMPGEEMINDQSEEKKGITVLVRNYYTEKEIHQFDLAPYELVTDFPVIFVGLEIVHCKDSLKRDCSFSFAGWEKGKYIYRLNPGSGWIISADDFTIYMKLYVSY